MLPHLNVAHQPGNGPAWMAQAWLESSDLALVANDNTHFPVHRGQLMAQSIVLAHLLAYPVFGAGSSITVPFSKSEIAFIIPYLYDKILQPIVSLTFDGVWRVIHFAVTFKITRLIDALKAAIGRYSHRTSSLEDTVLAFFVSSALKDHELLNCCFKKVLHLNPTPKILMVTLIRMINGGKLMNTPAVRTTGDTLIAASRRRLHTRMATHRALHQNIRALQVAHHFLAPKKCCNCTSAVQIDYWWNYALKAKQHDLKTLVRVFEGNSLCAESARKALQKFWFKGEMVEPIRLANMTA